jgi:hypothetical protein
MFDRENGRGSFARDRKVVSPASGFGSEKCLKFRLRDWIKYRSEEGEKRNCEL